MIQTGTEYRCVVADPPWPYRGEGKFGASLEHRPNRDKTRVAGNAGSRRRYGAMGLDELAALKPPTAPNAHLYLWFTNAFAVEAHAVARAWGFKPSTILTWVKVRQADGQPSMKMGWHFRGATEHVLFAVRGKLRLHAKRALPTAYLWPRTPHSVKPDQFYQLVEEASPGPYLEMFARSRRDGWDGWGDEYPEADAAPLACD